MRASPCSFAWKSSTHSTTRCSRLLRPPRRTSRSVPSRRPPIVSVRSRLARASRSKPHPHGAGLDHVQACPTFLLKHSLLLPCPPCHGHSLGIQTSPSENPI